MCSPRARCRPKNGGTAVGAEQPRDFFVRVPARLLKNENISPEARLLWCTLGAFADGGTGRTHVGPETLKGLLGCGRTLREEAQRELCKAGWLRIEFERGDRGRWSRRIYILSTPPPLLNLTAAVPTVARSGKHHVRSQTLSVPKEDLIISQGGRPLLTEQATVNGGPGTDDFIHSALETLRKDFPGTSARRLAWAVSLVARRAKTPPWTVAFFHRALPGVFENLDAEVGKWLATAAAKRLAGFPALRLPDLAEDLKQLAAGNDLPYAPETLESALDGAFRKVQEERQLQSELAVGRGPGARE